VKVDLRGRKDLGQIIGFAYRVYAANLRGLLLIALLTIPLPMLGAVLSDRVEDQDTETLLLLPVQLAEVVVTLIIAGALAHAVNDIANGVPVQPGASLDAALARFRALATTQLLVVSLVVASVVAFPYTATRYVADMREAGQLNALTIAGTLLGMFAWFWLRWNLTLQAVMLSGGQNWSALDESARLVRGQWWRVLGIVLAIVIVAIIPASFVASTAAFFPVLISAVIVSSVTALVLPFVIAAQTLLYFDLKARTESYVSPA